MSAPSATKARTLASASRHAGVGARQQQNALVAAGLDRSPAAQNRMLAIDHQLRAVTAKRTRPYLVLDQHCGGAAARISTNNLLDGESIAVTGIAIGEPQDMGRRCDAALNRIGHFVETHQIHVRHGEAHRRHARAGDKAGAKTGFLDQPGTHPIAATRHYLQPRFVEQRLQCSSLLTHSCLPGYVKHGVAGAVTGPPRCPQPERLKRRDGVRATAIWPLPDDRRQDRPSAA